jgi:ParB/RepB/Spo0J family partition protein
MNGFQTIPLSKLEESALNPRKHFDKKTLDELASSIKAHGVLTPILVRPSKGNGHFEIAAGHRRFRAAKAAGVGEIPAVVKEMSDVELLEILTIENLQREDVHPLEEADGYKALLKAGFTVERIAERVGRSVKYVYDRMKLLELCPEGRELFFEGKITAGHAILLSRLKPADQKRAIGSGKSPASVYRPADGGVFVYENAGLLGDDEDRVKAVSVRELEAWIAHHVRFDAKKDADPYLFPTAAANLERAAEAADKVVPITREYQLSPDARGENKERVLTVRSWRRADGELDDRDRFDGSRPRKTKVCDNSVIGVVVTGEGRGDAFRVCTNKTCKTHWAEEIREKAQRAKGGASRERVDAREKARSDAYERQRAREDAQRKAWARAVPAIVEAFAEKIAAAKGLGQVADIVLRRCHEGRVADRFKALAPKGKTADAVLRRSAFYIVLELVLDEWQGPRDAPKLAKAFGVDLQKLIAPAACRKCGCTEDHACEGGCSWAEPDLCSSCAQTSAKKKAARS